MSLNNRVTICVPTKNRPSFLYRLLNYYSDTNFEGWIFIGDESENEFLEKNIQTIDTLKDKVLIKHFQLKNLGVNRSLELMSGEINTPFCLSCADDDFVTTNGIINCMKFLDKNSDYGAVHGRGVIISLSNEGPLGTIVGFQPYPQAVVDAETGSERLKQFLNSPKAEAFSVHRTEIWKNMFSNFDRYSWVQYQQISIDELICSGVSAISGKIKEIDCLYLIRQSHGSQFKRLDPYELITHSQWSIAVVDMQKRFIEELIVKDNIGEEEAKAAVKKAFWPYLTMFIQPKMIKKRKTIINFRESIKKIPLMGSLWPSLRRFKRFLDYIFSKIVGSNDISLYEISKPSSVYYKDFRNIISACHKNR